MIPSLEYRKKQVSSVVDMVQSTRILNQDVIDLVEVRGGDGVTAQEVADMWSDAHLAIYTSVYKNIDSFVTAVASLDEDATKLAIYLKSYHGKEDDLHRRVDRVLSILGKKVLDSSRPVTFYDVNEAGYHLRGIVRDCVYI